MKTNLSFFVRLFISKSFTFKVDSLLRRSHFKCRTFFLQSIARIYLIGKCDIIRKTVHGQTTKFIFTIKMQSKAFIFQNKFYSSQFLACLLRLSVMVLTLFDICSNVDKSDLENFIVWNAQNLMLQRMVFSIWFFVFMCLKREAIHKSILAEQTNKQFHSC